MIELKNKQVNYYEILQVNQDATVEEIKKAYKKMVLIFHPDIAKTAECTDKFKEIVKAYMILKDSNLRSEYDENLHKKIFFTPKFQFEFSYYDFKKRRDDIINKFKILFKNISGLYMKNNPDKSTEDLDASINLPEDIINMPAAELEDRLQYSQNKYVCINAALAIGYKREKRSLFVLEKTALDAEYEIRKAAIWAIGNLKMKKSLQFLKILYNSINSLLKVDILKTVYKITDGKSALLHEMLITAFNDNQEEVRITGLELFLRTNKKLNYKELKGIFNNISRPMQVLVNRLIDEGRIIN